MNALERLKAEYEPAPLQLLEPEEMQWFRDSKFGMMLHWGVYSLLGKGEWVLFNDRLSVGEYSKLADRFTGEDFDARQWARLAKRAGMKYVVLTARHHDGFCLFDSKVSSFNSMNSPAHRDFIAEYTQACREEGLKVGLYYSPMDWRFPGYFFPNLYFENAMEMRHQCQEQLRELMTNYGRIDILWVDGGDWLAHGGIKDGPQGWYREPNYSEDPLFFNANYFWRSEEIINMIRQLQPGIMINNRFGCECDFQIRERFIGGMRTNKPWESADCLSESWGWIPNAKMHTLTGCIQNLVQAAVRDGNTLLNVSPDPTGGLEPRFEQRMEQIGDWMQRNGDAIYGTRGGPVLPGEWGGCTYRDNKIFVHILHWHEDRILLTGIREKLVSWQGKNVREAEVTETGEGLLISVPVDRRDPIDTIVELTVDKPVSWEGVESNEMGNFGLGDGLARI